MKLYAMKFVHLGVLFSEFRQPRSPVQPKFCHDAEHYHFPRRISSRGDISDTVVSLVREEKNLHGQFIPLMHF